MKLRPATRDDAPAIRRLLSKTYTDNPKLDEDVMLWQYWENPSGDAISWIWEDDGEVVCHSARLPLRVHDHVTCGLGVDAATAPSHRRRGLYAQLRDALHSECRERGIATTLLFLGADSIVPEVDPKHGVRLRTLVLPLDARWVGDQLKLPTAVVAPLVRRTRAADGASEVAGPPEGLDALWECVKADYGRSIVKNEEYWRWRYGGHPRAPYRFFEARDARGLAAAAVTTLRPMRGALVVSILDLIARSDDAARAVVGAVAAGAGDAPAVAFIASQASAAEGRARRAGLRRLPRWTNPGTHALGVWDTATNAPLVPPGDWCTTWGDADYL